MANVYNDGDIWKILEGDTLLEALILYFSLEERKCFWVLCKSLWVLCTMANEYNDLFFISSQTYPDPINNIIPYPANTKKSTKPASGRAPIIGGGLAMLRTAFPSPLLPEAGVVVVVRRDCQLS